MTRSGFVNVLDKPVANFDFQTDGTRVIFDNQSTGADTYSWEFGDLSTSSEVNPVYNFEEKKIFDVILNASNAYCANAIIKTIDLQTTSVQTIANSPFSIWPNPFQDKLKIKIPQTQTTPIQVRMYNSTGQVVLHQVIKHSLDLNTANLNYGLYHVTLETDQSLWIGKFLKTE